MGIELTPMDIAVCVIGGIVIVSAFLIPLSFGIYRLVKYVGWKLFVGFLVVAAFIVMMGISAFSSCQPLTEFMQRGF